MIDFFGGLAVISGIAALALISMSAASAANHGHSPQWEATAIYGWCGMGALVLGLLFALAWLSVEDVPS